MNHTRPAEPAIDIKNRDSIIAWLEWNDPNGCYSDADTALENLEPLTLDDARDLLADQLDTAGLYRHLVGDKDTGLWSGTRFWSGLVHLATGSVVAVYPYAIAEEWDFGTGYLTDVLDQQFHDQVLGYFWINDGILGGETEDHEDLSVSTLDRIAQQIVIQPAPCATCGHDREHHAFFPNGEPAPLCVDADTDPETGIAEDSCDCEAYEARA